MTSIPYPLNANHFLTELIISAHAKQKICTIFITIKMPEPTTNTILVEFAVSSHFSTAFYIHGYINKSVCVCVCDQMAVYKPFYNIKIVLKWKRFKFSFISASACKCLYNWCIDVIRVGSLVCLFIYDSSLVVFLYCNYSIFS